VPRYVLYRRRGRASAEEIEAIVSRPGVELLESEAGRILLVETGESGAAELESELSDWTVERERPYPHPAVPPLST
jgi:hypothetical protein